MPKSRQPWQRLNALAVALEAAAAREPYPRLAQLMESLAAPHAGMGPGAQSQTYR
jgi:hypothetical protein